MDEAIEPTARFDNEEPLSHDGIEVPASGTDQLDAEGVVNVPKRKAPLTYPDLNLRMPRQWMKVEQHAGRRERLVNLAKDVDHALGRQSSQ